MTATNLWTEAGTYSRLAGAGVIGASLAFGFNQMKASDPKLAPIDSSTVQWETRNGLGLSSKVSLTQNSGSSVTVSRSRYLPEATRGTPKTQTDVVSVSAGAPSVVLGNRGPQNQYSSIFTDETHANSRALEGMNAQFDLGQAAGELASQGKGRLSSKIVDQMASSNKDVTQ